MKPDSSILNRHHTVEITAPLGRVRPGPYQKRQHFERGKLLELARSIRSKGLLHPPIVVQAEDGYFDLLSGERRWRASCALVIAAQPGMSLDRAADLVAIKAPAAADWPVLDETPITLYQSRGDARQQRILSAVDNLHREDLNAVELAEEFQSLKEEGLDEAAIAAETGFGVTYIKRKLALLDYPPALVEHIRCGRLSEQAANTLADLPSELQVEVADKMIGKAAREIKMVVNLVKRKSANGTANGNGRPPLDQAVKQAETKARPLSHRAQARELRRMVSLMLGILKTDADLLQRCADGLAETDYELAETCFSRSRDIDKILKRQLRGKS